MVTIIAVCITILAALLILAAVIVYFGRRRSKETALEKGWAAAGDLSRRQEKALIRQLVSAGSLFRKLLATPDTWSMEFSVLSITDRKNIEKWLQEQESVATSLHPALYPAERLSVNKYDKFPD